MRSSLFTNRQLRPSYRNIPMDDIVALLDKADEQDDALFDSCCLHRPQRLRSCVNEEDQR